MGFLFYFTFVVVVVASMSMDVGSVRPPRRYFYITTTFLHSVITGSQTSTTYTTRLMVTSVDAASFVPSFEAFDDLARQARIAPGDVTMGIHALEITQAQHNQLLLQTSGQTYPMAHPPASVTRPPVVHVMSLV